MSIKNLNVNPEYINKPPKKKFSLKKAIVTGSIVVSIALSTLVGCTINEIHRQAEMYRDLTSKYAVSDTYTSSDNSVEITTPSQELEIKPSQEVYIDSGDIEYIPNEYNVTLSEVDNEIFIDSISNDIYYPLEEHYQINEALNLYQPLPTEVSHSDVPFTDSIDVNQLIRIVKQNNNAYLASLNDTQRVFFKAVPDDKIRDICQIIAESLNNLLETNPKINREEVFCQLSTLSIFSKATTNNASITDDNCLIVNETMLELLQIQNPESEAFTETIIHEAHHIAQKPCQHLENSETITHNGIAYNNDDLAVNPLNWTWFVEASAEKTKMNLTGTEALVYQYRVDYLESIALATIFNNQEPIENLCFYRNLDALYQRFQDTSLQEKEDVVKLMFGIELMQVGDPGIDSVYKNQTGTELASENQTIFRYELKSSVCSSLTNVFYSNLANYIQEKSIPLNDIFFLINLFEQDINNHLIYQNSPYKNQYASFMTQYVSVQDSFFASLASSMNMRQEEIVNLFNKYALYTDTKEFNCNLSWLSNTQKDYIINRETYLESMNGAHIREVFAKEYQGLNLN